MLVKVPSVPWILVDLMFRKNSTHCCFGPFSSAGWMAVFQKLHSKVPSVGRPVCRKKTTQCAEGNVRCQIWVLQNVQNWMGQLSANYCGWDIIPSGNMAQRNDDPFHRGRRLANGP